MGFLKGRTFFPKTEIFVSLSGFYPAAYAKDAKVFWFFFSKKNLFLH